MTLVPDSHRTDIQAAVRSGHRAARAVESWFAESAAHDEGFATASGSQALVAALWTALDVRPGPVALPAYDWVAASGAAAMLRADVIWCDIGAQGVISPGNIETLNVTPAVVVATDLFGYPVDVAGIRTLLPDAVIVEDASQALGAHRRGSPAGVDADIVIWSLGRGKLVDALEGGVVACSDRQFGDRLHDIIRHPSVPPRLRGTVPRGIIGRLHPAAALLAANQLDDIEHRIANQISNGHQLTKRARLAGITTPPTESGVQPSFHCPIAHSAPHNYGDFEVGGLAYQALGTGRNALRWASTARCISSVVEPRTPAELSVE